ncbi:MAG: S9 family peptidase [Vicinamibacterales bacterium]
MSARAFVRAACFLAVVGAGFSQPAAGQQPPLSIDTIFNPATRIDYAGSPTTNVSWLDADTWLQTRRGERGLEWVKVDAASGQATPLFDASRMEAALAALPGVNRGDAAQAARSGGLTFDEGHTAALATIGDDLYVYEFAANRARRLTSAPGPEEEATFSPDGRLVAFVRGNNLHVVTVANSREQALTTDGGAEIFNGKLDWLYQEEIYGRGQFKGYWWSPDSARLAFLQLDERPVPEYTVVDHLPYRPEVEITDYPKAGDPNPLVKLGIARVAGGDPVWMDASAFAGDILIVDVSWHPQAALVLAQVQDREQTWLDLQQVDASTGRAQRLLRETTKAWVNNNGSPTWLKDGSFLWISERTGFRHLYHYRADGTEIRPVTSGRWDVRTFYGVSEEAQRVFFASNERGATEMHVYSAPLQAPGTQAPGTPQRLSGAPGWHRAVFNPTFTQYMGVWNDVTTPNQVRLHRADGTEVRVLDANPRPALDALRLPKPEFVQVKARDGFELDAMMIKPRDFNPARRYPVYQFTYAGPGAQSVKNQWGGTQYLYHQLLAEQDIIVWILDNRSASGKGVESQWPVYGRLGEMELQDLEDGIAWLRQQPYIDASRMVLHGWSYGGFMTAYALTHSTSWSAGIVGAPVSDWRDYDSVYTERLMKTPQNNPDGYRRTAPRHAAANLQARMLLVHGTMDDNVHMQNSVQFAYDLQQAGKPFEMMVYAKQRHGFTDPQLITHLNRTMFDFVMRAVAAPDRATSSR